LYTARKTSEFPRVAVIMPVPERVTNIPVKKSGEVVPLQVMFSWGCIFKSCVSSVSLKVPVINLQAIAYRTE